MIANKEIERLPQSAVKLSVTIEKDAVRAEYGDLLKKYSKTAKLKGFRPGHVPGDILEKKYGDSLKHEASANIMEKALKDIFEQIDEKPLPYVTPELQGDFTPDLDKNLEFAVVYDVFPEVTVGEYRGLSAEEADVEISSEDEQREIDILREQNALVVDKKEDTVAKNDIVTITYYEVDEGGKEIPNTRREGFVFTVGTGYNLYKLDDDIVGMKKDTEKVIAKDFPEDFEYEILRGKKVTLKVTVTALKEKQLPEMDDELAQDISEKYKTLADLKADIRQKLEEVLKNRLKSENISALIKKVVDASEVDLPKSMVSLELDQMWHNFVSRLRGTEEQVEALLGREGKSKEELFKEWTPAAERSAKTELVIHKMIEKESLVITDNEIEDELKREAESSNTPLEELKAQYEKERVRDYLVEEMKKQKLYDIIITAASITKGGKRKFMDVMGNNK
ncbi:MAG: trigger factor [Spirochaetales bacterium]|nr:MAG: trigger factor [Spirochaetales bacterium]